MFGITGMTVPALAAIPPGPRLSVLLASMELSSCGSVELFHVCVHKALAEGRIDLPRARAFSDGLADLDVDTARRVPDATLLPVEDHEPGPPPGYVDDAFDNPPLEDAYGRP